MNRQNREDQPRIEISGNLSRCSRSPLTLFPLFGLFFLPSHFFSISLLPLLSICTHSPPFFPRNCHSFCSSQLHT